MPVYDDLPDVFPPVIEPVNYLGDVPAFAYAEKGFVVAWSPPSGFSFKEMSYAFDFTKPELEQRRLHIVIEYRDHEPQRRGRERLESSFESWRDRALHSMGRLRGELDAGKKPHTKLDTVLESDVTLSAPRDEWRCDYRWHIVERGLENNLLVQRILVHVREDELGATAMSVTNQDRGQSREEGGNLSEPADMDELRAELVEILEGRTRWPLAGLSAFWMVDVGFAVRDAWRMRRAGGESEPWHGARYDPPAGSAYRWYECETKAGFEAFVRRDLYVADDFGYVKRWSLSQVKGATDVHAQFGWIEGMSLDGVPAFRAFEARSAAVPPRVHSRHSDDEDEEDEDLEESEPPRPTPGLYLRGALFALGDTYLVGVYLLASEYALEGFEAHWDELLRRLHVWRASGED